MGELGQTVLVVDDEEPVLRLSVAMLRNGGYSILAALDPLRALDQAREFHGHISLLLADVMMPRMGGLNLAQTVLAERPTIRVLLMSAYSDTPSGLPLLPKPFGMRELLERVAQVIAGPPPSPAAVLLDRLASAREITASLTAALDDARRRYLEEGRSFAELIRDLPSAIPHPDGPALIEAAADARRRAFLEYEQARRKLEQRLKDQPADPSRTDHAKR